MFAEKVGQPCSTTGTGSFALPVASTFTTHRTWRSGFSTGAPAFYLATNDLGTVWEIGYGTFTTGSPDTLTRNLIASSSGSLISWVTVPYRVYSAPSGVVMAHLIAGGKATSRPAWLQQGGGWLDDSVALAWSDEYVIDKIYTGSADVEKGRVESGDIYVPSPRNRWVDIGTAGVTMTANHIGCVLLFDTTAAARTFTLLAGATAGIGHGFTCWVLGYGSTANGVVLDPDGSEVIDDDSAGANVTLPPNRLVRLSWDGGRSKWRTDFQRELETDLASATTTDLGSVRSANIRITGTTTITGLGTAPLGTTKSVRFAAALTLTYNATSLILQGGNNIVTAAGDTAEFVSLGSGNWFAKNYTRLIATPANERRASAYCTVSGGTLTEQKKVNISSVVRDAAGRFTVTMSPAMPDANYRVLFTAGSTTINQYCGEDDSSFARNTTTFRLYVGADNGGSTDPSSLNIEVFG